MNQENEFTSKIHPESLTKRMVVGAFIGFILIALLLVTANNPNPEWPRYWMLKPLIVVPIAGAMGGLLNYYLDHLRFQGGWLNVLAIGLSIAGYLLCLWLGMVLGLNSTLWD